MTKPTPPPRRRLFFRKTRELGEKEWAFGLTTSPIGRFFRAKKRLTLIQRFEGEGNRAREMRTRLDDYANHSHWPVTVILSPHGSTGGRIADHAFEIMGGHGLSTVPYARQEKIFMFGGHGNHREAGTMVMQFDPITRRMEIEIEIKPLQALGIEFEQGIETLFHSAAWKRSKDLRHHTTVFTWEARIPEAIIEEAGKWYQAHNAHHIGRERYWKNTERPRKRKHEPFSPTGNLTNTQVNHAFVQEFG